jgi:hypothetical protein
VSRHTSCILAAVLLTYGCHGPRPKSIDSITRTETVERKVPVAVPCAERVKRLLDALANPSEPIPADVEGKVEMVTRSDSQNREYIARLEASARRCGVVIE